MALNTARQILTVFIASPGDLVEERKVAKSVVDEVNEMVSRRLGWQIELLGWEETLPGYGRPQELINRDVETCDLFIGVLWRRWGQSTRQYSSGFEEEFELARKRREESGSPELWLFFKRIDEDQVRDPGEQLKRVLEFQEAQITAKELLFKDFDRLEDWRAKVHKYLLQYLLDLAIPRGLSLEKNSSVSSPIPQESDAAIPSTLERESDESPALLQYKTLLNSIGRAITSTDVNFPLESDRLTDEFYAARLHLLAMAWMSSRYTNELLSVHEINLLYRHREQLQTIAVEATLIFETLIGNSFDTAPGWWWFLGMTEEAVENLLLYLATSGRDVLVRQRSIELMAAIQAYRPIELSQRKTEVEIILRDQSEEVRKAVLRYISAAGDMQDIPLIEPLLSDEDSTIRNEAERTKLLIIARNNPQEALQMLATDAKLIFLHAEEEGLNEIGKRSARIQDRMLLDLIRNQDLGDTIRTFALKELSQRSSLSKEVLQPLLEGPSLRFKAACFEELIILGENVDPKTIRASIPRPEPNRSSWLPWFSNPSSRPPEPDDLILRLYESFPLERITPHINWYAIDGKVAYDAMATVHGAKVLARLRSDLQNQFEVLRQESINGLRGIHGEFTEQLVKSYEELDDYIRYGFTKAALSGLALHGGPEDVEIARACLGQKYFDDLKVQAVRVLKRFGTNADVSLILEIMKDHYGDLKTECAIAALQLSPGVNGIAATFLSSSDTALVELAIDSLKESGDPQVRPVLQSLINHKIDSIRVKAVTYLIETLSASELTGLLNSYLEQPSYFYNVVCWLDRALYAPSPLKEAFEQRLRR